MYAACAVLYLYSSSLVSLDTETKAQLAWNGQMLPLLHKRFYTTPTVTPSRMWNMEMRFKDFSSLGVFFTPTFSALYRLRLIVRAGC